MSENHLPWPPPGLEPMQGRALALARRLAVADVFFLGALTGFSLSAQPSGSQVGGPATLCLLLALIGSLMFVSAALGIWRASREGGTNVWRGYTWLTIAEVSADRNGDTGALIGGAGAFAELSAETRNGLRMARLATSAMRLTASLLPLPAFLVLGLVGGSGAPGTALTVAIVLLPSMVLLAFASVAGSAEQVALRPFREKQLKRFDRRTDAIKISDAWYASFDSARDGQAMGRGPAGGVLRAWALGGLASVVIIGSVAVMIPIWLLAAAGSAGAFGRMPVFASNDRTVQQYAYLRAFTPAVDSTITPERAGEAFHAISERGAQGTRAAYVKPPVHTYPGLPVPTNKLFPTVRRVGGAFPSTPILALAKNGLTPAQRAYVAEVAGNPVWEDFGIVARARRADMAAGAFITPFPPDLSPADLPGTRFSATRDLAYASTIRAASYLAEGHPADAERALRETIAFGFRMIDDGNTSFDPLIGVSMIGSAQDALLALYEQTANANGARLRALSETAARRNDVFASTLDYVLAHRDAPRGIRLSALQASALRVCGSVHGLLFGPSSGEQRMLKSLRAQIARTPAEEALFDLDAAIAERPVKVDGTMGFGASLLLFGARISGAVFHAPRIPNCVAAAAGVRGPIF